jgi:DNA-binding NarL/FixJ family response regulator
MNPARTVLIVDDQAPFRAVARTVVSMTPGFDVVAEAESGEEAVTEAIRLEPDVVLMDINMGGISGIEATRRILAIQPGVRVVLLSTYEEQDLPDEARTCGAARYVHKEDFEPGVLLEVLPQAPAS